MNPTVVKCLQAAGLAMALQIAVGTGLALAGQSQFAGPRKKAGFQHAIRAPGTMTKGGGGPEQPKKKCRHGRAWISC
ncbi:MAG: hypothetical protein KGQ37_02390 [Hyphomicrobiales bacterium]|nr:hypothetical protein [Hyphomicrobiales bacterium]